MAINSRHFLEDGICAVYFGFGCSAGAAATRSESFRESFPPLVIGNFFGASSSSLVGNVTFKAAVWVIQNADIRSETAKRVVLVVAAIGALIATLGLGVLIQNRFETLRGEEFADSLGLGMAFSMMAAIFLMKDRYNQAARQVRVQPIGLFDSHIRAHGHGHGHGRGEANA